MSGLNEGQMVNFVIEADTHLPAMIVKIWDRDSGMVNLTIFDDHVRRGSEPEPAAVWRKTSVLHSDTREVGTWY